jgi:integrase
LHFSRNSASSRCAAVLIHLHPILAIWWHPWGHYFSRGKIGGIVALTDAACRKAKPGEKDYKLGDSGGLYLYVTTKGAKSWRMKYRFGARPDGKPGKAEKRITFGLYPEVSLIEARDMRDAARKILRADKDPAVEMAKDKAAAHAPAGISFKPYAETWIDEQAGRWSKVHRTKSKRALERDVYPSFGDLPLAAIDGPMILATLRKVEKRGAIDTAKRIRQHISGIFAKAVSESLVPVDPAASLGKALLPLPTKKKQPARTEITKARAVLLAVEDPESTAGALVKLASRLLALTGVRPGIVRGAPWEEFEGIDWETDEDAPAALWRIPAERMKLALENKEEQAFDHHVPMPRQAVEVLRAVRRLTGRIAFLFPNARSIYRPMSENALSYAYARCGFSGRHVPHGWRASFSTIMNEWAAEHGREGDRAVIDGMLAHVPKGVSSAENAYNRAKHMKRRRELAQIWANMLCEGLLPADDLLLAHED